MSSNSIHTQSNNALHDAPRTSATVGLFDQAMVTAVVIAIAYIAFIMVGGCDAGGLAHRQSPSSKMSAAN